MRRALALAYLGLWLMPAPPARALMMQEIVAASAAGGCVTGYSGPADVVASPLAWYGMRGMNAAYTSKAVRLHRASDAAEQDINILCGGNLDTASAATFCAATTCTAAKLYDQTGGGRDVLNTTVVDQPVYTTSCSGSLPCLTYAAASSTSLTSTVTHSQAQPYTAVAAAKRTSTTTDQLIFGDAGFVIDFYLISADLKCSAGSSIFPTGVTENTFHAIQFIANGASPNSNCRWDTTNNTGSGGATSATGNFQVGGVGLTGVILEAGFWPVVFAAGDLTSMNSNIKTYWGY